MGVLDVLSGLSTAAGMGFQGYGQDEQTKVKNALAQQQQAEDERRNGVMEALASRTPRTPNITSVGPNGTPVRAEDVPGASVYEAPKPVALTTGVGPGGKPIRVADVQGASVYQAPQKETQDHFTFPTMTGPDGKQLIARANTSTGAIGPTDIAARTPSAGTGAGAGGGVRGVFGQGGIFGGASAIGSISEMGKANPNLATFENGFRTNVPTQSLQAIDRFRMRLADDLQTHGTITAAVSSEAERELAKTNPDLVVYGRNLGQWIVGDLNVSRNATDRKATRDQAVSGLSFPLSSMPLAQRNTYIDQMQEGRRARLAGLQRAVPAAEAVMNRIAGTAISTSGTPGNVNLGAPSPIRQKYDAAVAHLKATGRDAEIQSLPVPPEEE
jgi:hypothetical protein